MLNADGAEQASHAAVRNLIGPDRRFSLLRAFNIINEASLPDGDMR